MRTGTAAAANGASPSTGAPSPPRRVPGELVLGRYTLIRVLGRGGAGTVWQAEDTQLERRVAIKCLPGDGRVRALDEARAAARLGHPTVVGTYGVGVADGCTWLVTEYVAGDTLRRTIAEDTHDDDELLQIGVALCVALGHAHGRGVIHRDVTPRNVLVPHAAFPGPDSGRRCHPHVPPAKLADFGIARRAVVLPEPPAASSGRVVGTLSYMAPERLHGAPGDAASDLWALAVVLHEAFVGEHPAGRPAQASALVRTRTALPSLAARRPDLPPVVVAAIDRAAAVEPRDRGAVADLERALRRGLADRAVAVAPVLRPLPVVGPPPPRRRARAGRRPSRAVRRRRGLLVGLLVAVAVLACLGGAGALAALAVVGVALVAVCGGATAGSSRHPVASGDRVGPSRVARY